MTNPVSAPAPTIGRVRTGYGRRAMAAILDGLVAYTMLFLIVVGWTIVGRVPAGPTVEAPPLMKALFVLSLVLYLQSSAMLGQTLGMRALGLRIVRSDDGSGLRPRQALSRTLVLLVASVLLFAAHPALVVAYSFWMLFNARRQMPHDQIAGTLVIRTSASTTTAESVGGPDPSLGLLEQPQAQAMLDHLDLVRRRARGDLHEASVPLFVLGLLSAGGVVVGWNQLGDLFWLSSLFWSLAGPVGLILTGWWFRRLQRRQGVGTGVGQLAAITILVTCASFAFWIFPIGGVITALGFLAFALSQGNRVLAAAAVVFGVVTGAEQPFRALSFGISNRFPDAPFAGIFIEHGNGIVLAVLALLLLAGGAANLRRELVLPSITHE